jgi:hypothetical protein
MERRCVIKKPRETRGAIARAELKSQIRTTNNKFWEEPITYILYIISKSALCWRVGYNHLLTI